MIKALFIQDNVLDLVINFSYPFKSILWPLAVLDLNIDQLEDVQC